MNAIAPHRRWNPLAKKWVLVSPHRAARPWQGSVAPTPQESTIEYDPKCYLCPGNMRASNIRNPAYSDVFVFDNDFAALLPEPSSYHNETHLSGVIRSDPEQGLCRVICFSPKHHLTLPDLEVSLIEKIIEVWARQYEDLKAKEFIRHVMIFENKGEMMGCSNPHPHGQIWATSSIPDIPAQSIQSQGEYFSAHRSRLLGDYLSWELQARERVLFKNEHWVALVPYWAMWPYETMILPRRHVRTITELRPEERGAWAAIIKELTTCYDNLFKSSFPYSMGIYQAPCDGKDHCSFTLYQVFYPPLLRSATVRKFMVGYELCAEPQRDLTPEQAAGLLRNVIGPLYRRAS